MNDFYIQDTILNPLTYDDLVLMAQNINPANGNVPQLLRKELCDLLTQKREDCLDLFDEHINDIMVEAFPEEQKLRRDPNFSEEACEQIAKDIYDFLLKHEMWQDVCIYYNGKCMSTSDGEEFRYNGEPFIAEDKDPCDYFEYVSSPHILSMSFEGPFYECLNGYGGDEWKIEEEFRKLLEKHGVYHELGNAWNLTCFPN